MFALVRDTSVEGEPARLHAAYTLAHDPESVSGLCELVYSEHQCVRRYSPFYSFCLLSFEMFCSILFYSFIILVSFCTDECFRSALYGLSTSTDKEVVRMLQEVLEGSSKLPYKNELVLALSDMGANALSALPAIFNVCPSVLLSFCFFSFVYLLRLVKININLFLVVGQTRAV